MIQNQTYWCGYITKQQAYIIWAKERVFLYIRFQGTPDLNKPVTLIHNYDETKLRYKLLKYQETTIEGSEVTMKSPLMTHGSSVGQGNKE